MTMTETEPHLESSNPSSLGVEPGLRIEPGRCIRCAAAASMAPTLFSLGSRGNQVLKQPETARERALARSASLLCPVRAILFEERGRE
jgi:ferredoxin